MDIPETITKIISSDKAIPKEVEIFVPIPDIETANLKMKGCNCTVYYDLVNSRKGNAVTVAYYKKRNEGGITIG